MLKGKKGTAQKILYKAFDLVSEKTKEDAFEVFKKRLIILHPKWN